MLSKTKIYIDKDSLEIIAQDSTISDNYYKNIIEIFRRHADLYVNLSTKELNDIKEPSNLENPGDIFTFIVGKSLPWPYSGKDIFDAISQKNNNLEINGSVIYILNKKEDVKRIRENFGVWALSVEDVNDNIFHFGFNKGLNLAKIPGKSNNGWSNLLSDVVDDLPLSNSFVVSDSNLLTNDILDKNNKKHYCGLENLKDLFSILLPKSLDVPFYILVICPPTEQIGKMKKIISTWMEEVRKLRTYTIIIEFFTTKKTLHARGVFANNYRIHLDKGFYVFIPWTIKVHVDGDSFNKLDIKSYLHSPFDKGDSLMDVAIMELERISNKYTAYLRNTGDPIIVEPIKEHYNKNRILF